MKECILMVLRWACVCVCDYGMCVCVRLGVFSVSSSERVHFNGVTVGVCVCGGGGD